MHASRKVLIFLQHSLTQGPMRCFTQLELLWFDFTESSLVKGNCRLQAYICRRASRDVHQSISCSPLDIPSPLEFGWKAINSSVCQAGPSLSPLKKPFLQGMSWPLPLQIILGLASRHNKCKLCDLWLVERMFYGVAPLEKQVALPSSLDISWMGERGNKRAAGDAHQTRLMAASALTTVTEASWG